MKTKLKYLKKKNKRDDIGFYLDHFSIPQYDKHERLKKKLCPDEDSFYEKYDIDCEYGDFSIYDPQACLMCDFGFCDLPVFVEIESRPKFLSLTLDTSTLTFRETTCRDSKFLYEITPTSGDTSYGGRIFIGEWKKRITVYTYEIIKHPCPGCDDCDPKTFGEKLTRFFNRILTKKGSGNKER